MGSGREAQERRKYVYLWLIHVVLWQKPTQHCKAIILHLKVNKFKLKANKQKNKNEAPEAQRGEEACPQTHS